MQLQRAVANPDGKPGPGAIDGAAFARLLLDLYLCRAATEAQLNGTVALDPRLAEDLIGKTWRAEELEPVSGLELIRVAATDESTGELNVASSYLVDLDSRAVYVERQITPAALYGAPKTQHRVRLLVEEGGLYPGPAQRRIRLGRCQRAALRAEDVDRLLRGATDDLAELQRQVIERAAVPLWPTEAAALFRPTMLLGPPDQEPREKAGRQPGRPAGQAVTMRTIGALDRAGRFVRVTLPSTLAEPVPDGWAPPTPPKSRSRTSVDTVLPVARLWLDGREVWAFARPARGPWQLLDPPLPADTARPSELPQQAPDGIIGRLRQQLGQALGPPAAPPSHWLTRRLRGRLVWQARHPLGADGQVTRCTLHEPTWVDEPDDRDNLQVFSQMLAGSTPLTSAYIFAVVGGFRLLELRRDDAAAYVWLDSAAAEAFRTPSAETCWALVWMDGAAVVPVALVAPAGHGSPARLTHLIPGLPSDALALPA